MMGGSSSSKVGGAMDMRPSESSDGGSAGASNQKMDVKMFIR